MIKIKIQTSQLIALTSATQRAGKNVDKEMSAAINQVSKKTRLQVGRDVRSTVAMKKDESEKPLKVTTLATPTSLRAVVTLKKTPRLGLRHFGAKQNKRGVSYKISKKGGRKRVDSAFQGKNGNAFKRIGTERLPIVKLLGVSAYGAYVKNNLQGPQVKAIKQELEKQMERRIKLNILRANKLVTT